MKNNPLQQAHAAVFNMNQPQANLWIYLLKKILNNTLEKANCIPCRTVDALNKLLAEGQDIFIDGTEQLYFDQAILMFKTKKVRLWLDSGFEGFNTEINRPKNKPKGKDLTQIEKKSN
ncbi:MAG: hypothetical protein PHH37_03185 [Paludibacter sp.]|nr:hypothetical protein [Paludibacter sp.]